MVIETTKIEEQYRLTNRDGIGEIIFVTKEIEKGSYTIQTKSGKTEFCFINSQLDTIKAIGELLIKASEL